MTGGEEHAAELFPDTSVLDQDLFQTDTSLPWDLIDFSAASTSASEPVEANLLTERLGQSLTMDPAAEAYVRAFTSYADHRALQTVSPFWTVLMTDPPFVLARAL